MIFLDGVYTDGTNGHPMRFREVKAPTRAELTRLTHTIAQRVGRYLQHQGLIERDTGDIFLTQEAVEKVRPGTGREAGLGHASDEDPTNQLLGSSVTYRIAVGPQQGRKVFTLQTLPDIESDNLGINNAGEVAGFSLPQGTLS